MRLLVIGVVALVSAGACGHNARIWRRRGPPVDAQILGGSANSIYVRNVDGESFIRREDLKYVSHPGTGALLVGAGLLLLYISPYTPSIRSCREGEVLDCSGATLPIAAGAGLIGWGFWAHLRSVTAYRDTSRLDLGRELSLRDLSSPRPGAPAAPSSPPPPP